MVSQVSCDLVVVELRVVTVKRTISWANVVSSIGIMTLESSGLDVSGPWVITPTLQQRSY